MTEEPKRTKGDVDELELDKETIQDLDVPDSDADAVVGGGTRGPGGGSGTCVSGTGCREQ